MTEEAKAHPTFIGKDDCITHVMAGTANGVRRGRVVWKDCQEQIQDDVKVSILGLSLQSRVSDELNAGIETGKPIKESHVPMTWTKAPDIFFQEITYSIG